MLGSLPWSEDDLKKEYYRDVNNVNNRIKELPGYLIHRELDLLYLSLEIFRSSVYELFDSIEEFINESDKPGFWDRPFQEYAYQVELAIQRGMFASTVSALSLVSHCNKFIDQFSISNFEERKNETFVSCELHAFIHSFRRYVSHIRMAKADWHTTISFLQETKETRFRISQEQLLRFKEWKSIAKKMIKNSPNGVDIKFTFEKYLEKINKFYSWFFNQAKKDYETHLKEYRNYDTLIKGFDSYSNWNLLINQIFLPKKIDPYIYLPKYLNKEELNEILALERNSKEQVDKIIQILDEYKACDEKLRRAIYKLFKVKGN